MSEASDTPEVDAYIGTHETHRINGLTIYDRAKQLERERDEARNHLTRLENMGREGGICIASREYIDGITAERDRLRAQVCEVIEQGNECVSAVQGIPVLEPLTFSTAMEAIRAEINLGREKHREAQLEIHQLRARVAELEGVLKPLVKLWDRFVSDDASYENAYYTFYKGEYSKWDSAKKTLAKKGADNE